MGWLLCEFEGPFAHLGGNQGTGSIFHCPVTLVGVLDSNLCSFLNCCERSCLILIYYSNECCVLVLGMKVS